MIFLKSFELTIGQRLDKILLTKSMKQVRNQLWFKEFCDLRNYISVVDDRTSRKYFIETCVYYSDLLFLENDFKACRADMFRLVYWLIKSEF